MKQAEFDRLSGWVMGPIIAILLLAVLYAVVLP